MSEHPRENMDGLLSMWRGYGGHGHGVALIIDTSRIEFVETAPMYLLRVSYASGQERVQQLNALLEKWANIVRSNNIPENLLYLASYSAVLAIITFGLTEKHDGFLEEREWRLVYLPLLDSKSVLRDKLSYHIGTAGVEPKLKFKVVPGSAGDWPKQGLDTLLHKIILGPSVSSHLAKLSVCRMLDNIGKSSFKDRVIASTIPLRPAHPGR
jgi:hypothetical protein